MILELMNYSLQDEQVSGIKMKWFTQGIGGYIVVIIELDKNPTNNSCWPSWITLSIVENKFGEFCSRAMPLSCQLAIDIPPTPSMRWASGVNKLLLIETC